MSAWWKSRRSHSYTYQRHVWGKYFISKWRQDEWIDQTGIHGCFFPVQFRHMYCLKIEKKRDKPAPFLFPTDKLRRNSPYTTWKEFAAARVFSCLTQLLSSNKIILPFPFVAKDGWIRVFFAWSWGENDAAIAWPAGYVDCCAAIKTKRWVCIDKSTYSWHQVLGKEGSVFTRLDFQAT